MSFMKGITNKVAGLDALCDHYKELGIDASILPDDSPEALKKPTFAIGQQDTSGYIKIIGKNFDLVTIRMTGKGGGSWGCSGCLMPIPIASKEKTPFQYHHIIRCSNVEKVTSKTKLQKRKKGLFSKNLVSLTWKGGELATNLNADPDIERSLLSFLTTEDNLSVDPDKKNSVIRIVFSRPAETKAGLLQGFKFDRRLYPKEAVEAVDKIAGLVRSYLV